MVARHSAAWQRTGRRVGVRLPLFAEGSLHVRRRPVRPGELIVATSKDDVGFTATGRTELMVVVLPTPLIDRWVQTRRGVDKFDVNLPSPRWQVTAEEMGRRASALLDLLRHLTARSNDESEGLSQMAARIFDVILDMIPSAEVIELAQPRPDRAGGPQIPTSETG
jgi:AraC family transcriptional regulator, ethanolamine operon transcriptional activator